MPHTGDFDIQYMHMRICLRSKSATPTLLAELSIAPAAAATWLENAKMATKEVLVRVGVHSRVIRFDDKEALFSNIHAAFSDIGQVGTPNTKLLVQIKDQQWGGEFVDLQEDQNIPDRSVLNVIVIVQAEQVGFFPLIQDLDTFRPQMQHSLKGPHLPFM